MVWICVNVNSGLDSYMNGFDPCLDNLQPLLRSQIRLCVISGLE